MRIVLAATALILLGACSQQEGNEATGANAAAPTAAAVGQIPFNTDLPQKEFMAHVIQYSADNVWKHQGYIIDEKGETSRFPKNAEEWEEAESASLTLAEITNVLLVPGRGPDEPAWRKAVADVRAVAMESAKAAEKQDQEAFFEAGGKLDGACESCHIVYATAIARQPAK
jgi:hypothetical protein